MKLDILKLAEGIMTAIHVVEKINGAKGIEKADAVINSTPDMIGVLEGALSKDVLNDERVISAERNFVTAYVALQNTIRDVKAAKVKDTPES